MPRAQNGQTTSTRQRDYASLLDNAQLMRDGLQLRLDRMENELRRLLGGHQNANQVMQLLTRSGDGYAVLTAKSTMLDAKIAQYTTGLAEQKRETEVQAVSDIPVNPDDTSKDVEPSAEVSNGKVKIAA